MKRRMICFLLSLMLLLLTMQATVNAETTNTPENFEFTPTSMSGINIAGNSGLGWINWTWKRGGYTLNAHTNIYASQEALTFSSKTSVDAWRSRDGKLNVTLPFHSFQVEATKVSSSYNGLSTSEFERIFPNGSSCTSYKHPVTGIIYGSALRSDVWYSVNRMLRDKHMHIYANGYATSGSEVFAITCSYGGDKVGYFDIEPFGEYVPQGQGRWQYPVNVANTNAPRSIQKNTVLTCTLSFPHIFKPIVLAPPMSIETQDKLLGADYTSGVTGTWGHTTTNLIPPLGTILRPDIAPDAEDEFFSGADTTGVVHNIGIKNVPIRVIDSSGSADPSADTTDTQRKVTATTAEAPVIRAEIRAGAVNPQGGTADVTAPYSDVGGNPGGGVDGWTNYPITLICDGSAITGDYNLWSVWASPANGDTFPGTSLDKSTTVNGTAGEATSTTTVFKETATATGGWKVKGFCADKSDKSNLLSSESSAMELKYDPAAPMAGLSFHPETKTFSDTSTDGLSGVNPAVTGILFRAVGGPAPSEQDSDWQLLSNYTIPVTAANYDVYAKAYDRAGNYDIKLAGRNLKVNGGVEAAIDTDRGATVHAVGCPNPGSPTKVPGSCLAGCHDATTLALTEGSAFHYVYTLHDTDATVGASGTFVNYLPLGVVPMGSVFTDITSTSANATVTGTVAASPEPLGAHAGQFKVSGDYTLATGGDSLSFRLECRVPQYDPTPGAGNTFANHEGNIAYTMDNSLAGTADFSSAVHTVEPLPNHDLTLTKTVTGKYGNRDKEFTFRLDTEQSWGPKLNRVCNYTKANGASGTITITDGVIEKVDGTPTDYLTLKHGQDITIGLPEGCRFTVTEEPKEEYTATEKVDGVDYNPITAAAAKSATDKADKKDGTQTGTITPKQGADILSGVLPKGGGIMSAGKVRTGDAGNRLKGVSYGPAALGVVEGTINTANVKVDYFNDKSALAPPTGITDVDGGSGLLPILLAGVAALGIGFCLWKRRRSS